MKQAHAFCALIVLSFTLGGCRSKESEVVGSWSSSQFPLNITEDHKWTSSVMGGVPVTGTWLLDDNDVIVTTLTIGGEPVDKAKDQLENMASKLGSRGSSITKFADNLDKKNYFTLSDDGKSMVTDKKRDKNDGPAITLTKQDK